MKKTYKMELNNNGKNIVINLRLNIAGQRAIREKYNCSAEDFVNSCFGDAENTAALLGIAAQWEGNQNEITDGDDLYDLLIDNDYAGVIKMAYVILNIELTSGMIDKNQLDLTYKVIETRYNKAISNIDAMTDEEDEDKEKNEKNS